jgi:PAS domain S-box-containing protein
VENSNLVRIWGTTRDVTELKRAVLAAEASERRFRQVLEKIQSPALMLDSSGNITFCNDKFVHLAGCSKQELACRNWLDGIHSARQRAAWLALLTARDDPETRERLDSVIRSHDGIARLIVWDTILLRDEAGDPVGLAAIGTDKGPANLDRNR